MWDSDTVGREVAELLARLAQGDRDAGAQLLQALQSSLHGVAVVLMQNQPVGHTLQATALVNEAYLRLFRDGEPLFNDRKHFLSVAARAMRQVLVDHARAKAAEKRGGTVERHPLDGVVVEYGERAQDLIALDEALDELARLDPEMAEAVQLRFFGGRSMDEVAELLELSKRTLERRWETTRAWLYGRVR